MKKFVTTVVAMAITWTMFAQDIDRKEMKFDYIRLPMKPLITKGALNCVGVIVPEYENKISAQKAEYQRKLAEADKKYADAMAVYEQQLKDAEATYQKELDAYNKKSTAQKIIDKQVLEQGKPVKKTVYAPYKETVPAEHYQKSFSKEALAGEYLKLDGYQTNPANAVTITATMLGFDYTVDYTTETKNVFVKTGTTTTTQPVQKYFYVLKYRHPISVKVVSPELGQVSDELKFTDYVTFKSAEFNSKSEAEFTFNNNKDMILTKYEDEVVLKNMTAIKNELNFRHGFSRTAREMTLYTVEDKKVDYSDYKKAYEAAFEGMNMLYEGSTPTRARAKIAEAIAIWEAAMKESNMSDKKARVDADVTTITMFNLIEGNIWMGKYDAAEGYINKMGLMDLSKKERKYLEGLKEFFKDQKTRGLANQ